VSRFCESWGKRKRQQRKVGREEEGSNCLELAAFVLALRGTPVTKLMLDDDCFYYHS